MWLKSYAQKLLDLNQLNTKLLPSDYQDLQQALINSANNDLFKNNNKTQESKDTRKWRHWLRSNVFIVDFEYISSFYLLFLLSKHLFVGKVRSW